MLRDILQNTTFQLRAWLAQKDMEAKVQYGQRGSITTQTARPVAADASEDVLFARTGQDTYQSGQLSSTMSRSGAMNYTNAVTTHTPNDDVAKHYLSLKDKVQRIRTLHALLGDIADEITASYQEINMTDRSGNVNQVVCAQDPATLPANTRMARNARRARLGMSPV